VLTIKNVAFGYDVGKISLGCLVLNDFEGVLQMYLQSLLVVFFTHV